MSNNPGPGTVASDRPRPSASVGSALASLTWPEVADRAGQTILAVPVGSTEQHGPHLPLSTDTDIAVELSTRLAAEIPEVLVAPPIHFGSSGEHAGYPGTLSIGQSALVHLLVELCRSADAFAGLMLVSTHGGNWEAVQRAVKQLHEESRNVACWSPSSLDPSDSHAGGSETSCILSIRPEAVRIDRLEPGNVTPLPGLMPALRDAGVASVSANGVLGDPTGATARFGEQLLDGWATQLVLAVRARFPRGLGDPVEQGCNG